MRKPKILKKQNNNQKYSITMEFHILVFSLTYCIRKHVNVRSASNHTICFTVHKKYSNTLMAINPNVLTINFK